MSSRRRRAALAAALAGPPQPKEESKALTVVKKPERPVVVQRDHVMEYPELYMEVFVTEPSAEMMLAEMFARSKCSRAKSLEDADLVVFTGGPDVNPKLYHETPHKETRFNNERDKRDMVYYVEALKNRIPMLGICRGSQFLHVMQDGKLAQHIGDKKHVGDHGLVDKTGILGQRYIERISSTHHQLVLPQKNMEILASIYLSQERWFNKRDVIRSAASMEDIEAYFYRKPCILGIQGHPEFRGYARYTQYCMKLIEHKIVTCPDIGLENGKYRVKKEVFILDRS